MKNNFKLIGVVLLICNLGISNLNAQIDFNWYKPIQSIGEVPEDLTANAQLRYEQKSASIEDSDKGKRRKKDEKAFYLQNNFSIQDFLVSGQILYNDTFTRYIERIADTLLKNNLDLRKKLRFYTVKSPEVNAFATQEGIIFVNVGLFSAAKSEAQIAYILAHEISHFTEGHVLQGYLETRKIIRGEGFYRYQDYYSRLRSFFRYSRDSEYEADAKGWDLFKTSPYAKNAVHGVFDMLLYAHIHFDSIPFKPSYFEDEYFTFPSKYTIASTDSLLVDENREDNFSTHPNVKDRKKRTKKLIDNDSFGGLEYVVSKEIFDNLQRIARYEMLRYYVTNTNFGDAYYHALLLEKNYGSGKYIDYNKAMALYGLAKHANQTSKKRVLIPYKSVQGTPQQFYYFMNQLSGKEVAVLALRENRKWQEKYKNEPFFKHIEEDLIKLLVAENKVRAEDFVNSSRTNSDLKKEQDFFKFAFVKDIDDPLFYQKFQSYQTYRADKKKFNEINKYKRNSMLEMGIDKELEMDSLSMFIPTFERVIQAFLAEPKVDYLSKEAESTYLETVLTKAADEKQITLNFIQERPKNYSTEKYNAFSYYVDWFTERTNNGIEMIYFSLGNTDSVKNEYVGVMDVQTTVSKGLIRKYHFWEYNFVIFNKSNGALVYYQTLIKSKKYKRKHAKKGIEEAFNSIKKENIDDDDDE